MKEIMEKEGFIHVEEEEALYKYPKLAEVKNKIQRIRNLQFAVRQITGHPIPPNKEESQKLIKQIDDLAFLIKYVKML